MESFLDANSNISNGGMGMIARKMTLVYKFRVQMMKFYTKFENFSQYLSLPIF